MRIKAVIFNKWIKDQKTKTIHSFHVTTPDNRKQVELYMDLADSHVN